jgi:2-oxoglutarate ferredoxin oxidoreductase subunit delta
VADKDSDKTSDGVIKKPEPNPVDPPEQPAGETDSQIILKTAKGHLVLIKGRCKSCGFCVEFCPKKVLEFSSEHNAKGYRIPSAKNPDKCIFCGFCTMYCPDFAIYQTGDETPELSDENAVQPDGKIVNK